MSDDATTQPQAGEDPQRGAGQPSAQGPGEASTPARSSRVPNALRGWRAVRVAVALVCVAAGVAASVIAASTVARNDTDSARHSFQQGSAAVASALKLAVQRQEELAVSASTYFAHNPHTTAAEFDRWVGWARTAQRFPELDDLGLVALVHTTELPAFATRVGTHPIEKAGEALAPPALESTAAGTTTAPTLRFAASTAHGYECLAVAQLVRDVSLAAPPATDYCATSSALLLARDTGVAYARTFNGHVEAVTLYTPVYRGNVVPRSVAGRNAASVGWLREVLAPGPVLAAVLRGHPGYSARLSYTTTAGGIVFGAALAGRPTAQTSVRSWVLTTYGPAVSSGVGGDGDALALLILGCVASLLVAVLALSVGRPRLAVAVPAVVPARRRAASEELYDPLTGLPNRALSLDRAGRMVARAGRQSGILAGALLIDVDWFKDVNDKLGRAAGDQLLRIVAERLERVVRAGDTVGRYDGDEFVVLVESTARGARLDSLARRMIESLHKPVDLEGFGPSFFATASIGVAFGRYATAEDLLRDARLALLSAKAAGKDRYTLFNANMRSLIESRAVLEAELLSALQSGQFFLVYEPVFDLSTRRVVALEASVRWRHPKRGVLGPEEFMTLAEETGLIVPIGRWALEEACARGAAWSVAGHQIGVAVKISPNQLEREGFATDVRRALQQSGIEPSLLTVVLAETTVMRDIAAAAARLRDVKDMGVRVAIDDFGGSGYARNSDLRLLPLDVLMVDRGTLAQTEDEDYRSWLFEAILIVGRESSLTVIATGVETHEQLESIEAAGCAVAQGSFAGPPVTADAVDSVLLAGLEPAGAPADTQNGVVAQDDGVVA